MIERGALNARTYGGDGLPEESGIGNHRRNTQIKYRAISVSGTIAFAAISPGQCNAAPMAAATTTPRAATLIQPVHSTWVRLTLRNLAF